MSEDSTQHTEGTGVMEANFSSPPVREPQRGHLVELVEIGVTHWPAAIMTFLLVLAAYGVHSYLKPDPNADLPRVGDRDLNARWTKYLGPGSWDMYLEGYRKFKDRPFKITDAKKRDRIVLPASMLPELAKYPDEVVSGPELAAENMHVQYTMRDPSTPVFKRVLLSQLTPALARVTPAMREEVVDAMSSELPDSSDWTETTIHDKILRIVAKSTGRIFIGPECCREETYVEGSTNFITDLAHASAEINKIPWYLRPFKAPRLASVKLVRNRMKDFADILEPVIRKRKQEAAKLGDDYQKPDDMTQWMIESVDRIGEKEVMDIALEQAGISFSAVNSTTQHTSLAFFTLAAYPELEPIFLEEINQCLEESGGEWTNHALQNMKKLDSFLKEVGRFEPFTAYTFARKIMSPITLSNGMHLPKNTVIEVDWYGISQDEEIYPEPEQFDALRHYKLRQEKASKAAETQHQFVNISPQHLTWNYGRRACPGRFFAANIMKLMFANLLLRYEVRNAEGVEGRVQNIRAVGMQATNPVNKIQIRKR